MRAAGIGKMLLRKDFDAVLFDLDGVITDTAKVHAVCWKRLFDGFLQKHAEEKKMAYQPFDIEKDYTNYVDGKLRYEGVRSFLESRGIELPFGDADDQPGFASITGLGNLKDQMVKEVLDAEGIEVYEGSVTFLRQLRRQGFRTALVSASKNAEAVLQIAGIADLFDTRVDGEVADRLRLPGKPAPDTFFEAARQLGAETSRSVVIEDALSGVRAGREGGFGLVIGVARKGNYEALKQEGADIVVGDLRELCD